MVKLGDLGDRAKKGLHAFIKNIQMPQKKIDTEQIHVSACREDSKGDTAIFRDLSTVYIGSKDIDRGA